MADSLKLNLIHDIPEANAELDLHHIDMLKFANYTKEFNMIPKSKETNRLQLDIRNLCRRTQFPQFHYAQQ